MWGERFAIIGVSLSRAQLPAQWSHYNPTRYDVGVFVGTIGMFCMLFLLFFRFAPVIAISEVKGASPEAHAGKGGHH
jgi:molybdopterin-containing oxidoreductase family membrane subunit